MSSANPYALKKFFSDFDRFYEKKGAKKLKGVTEIFFKKRGHLKVPARFTDKFYSDLMNHPDRNEYCERISEYILNQIVGNKKIPTVPTPEEFINKKKEENKETRLPKLKEILERTVDFLEQEEPNIPVEKQIFILTGLLFITRGDRILFGPEEVFKKHYDKAIDFIAEASQEFLIPPSDEDFDRFMEEIENENEEEDEDTIQIEASADENTKPSPLETASVDDNSADQKDELTAESALRDNSTQEISLSTEESVSPAEEKAPELAQENLSKEAPAPTDENTLLKEYKKEESLESNQETNPLSASPSNSEITFESSYPRDAEEDEEDPEQLENAKYQRIFNDEYVTGQLKKTGYYWNFYPLYEWKDGSPNYIKDVRSRFGTFGYVNLTNLEALLPNDKKKLLRGAMYNIAIRESDLSINSQDRCEIDAPRLFREKRIWRADLDETDGGYRCAYYIVEPAKRDGWSVDDPAIKVKLAGYQVLPEDIEDLFKVQVLLNIDGVFIGPLKLKKDGQSQLTVSLSSSSKDRPAYVHDAYGKHGEPLWPMDAIRYEEPLEAVFTFPLFTPQKEVDLITDKQLLITASRAIPKEKEYIEKLEEWVQELPKTRGKSEIGLSRSRVKRLETIISNNKRVGSVFSSLVPSVTKLLASEIEGKTELLKEVAHAISENPQIIALLHPDPEFQKGLEKLKDQKQKLESDINQLKEDYKQEKVEKELEKEKSAASQEVNRLKAEINQLKDQINQVKAEKQKEEEELNKRKATLADSESQLESFEKRLNQTVEKVASLAFEGSLTAKIMAAADQWRAERDDSTYKARVQALRQLPKSEACGKELNKYLCETLEGIRKYNTNEFVNLFVCLAQSFLTVLAGSPGSGKTSLCNYVARLFGLTSIQDQKGITELWSDHPNFANRYIPVSVERGWTSKRDLIGYFNPLSRTFESVDPHRFECFRQLDYEAKEHFEELPYFLLLDEANLSPMEYYFADFMNICDLRNDLSFVSIGGDSRFLIPDSLRFLATVNNDHTTEMLSPRLVDRTWIIQLPETEKVDVSPDKADQLLANLEIIDWNKFRTTYAPKQKANQQLQQDLKKMSGVLSAIGMTLSPRTRIAIANYVSTAQTFMTKEGTGRTPYKVALDFAIAQKILPMINGSGETYKAGLDKLKEFLSSENLTKSASALDQVISKGTDAMDFYRFF